MIFFERPMASLLLLGLIPAIVLLFYARRRRRQALEKLMGLKLDSSLMAVRPLWRQNLSLALIAFAWLMATLACMAPTTPPRQQPAPLAGSGGEGENEILHLEEGEAVKQVRRPLHDLILLVDASASMGVADTRVGLSRLEYAKEIVDELISRLDGQSVALYAFTSELTPLFPSTIDYLYARLMVRNLRINEGDVAGTDFAEALDGVRRNHLRSGEKRARTLIILTDGGDTQLEELKGEERAAHLKALLSRVQDRERHHLQTFCIGLGSREGEEIPGILYNGEAVRSSLDEGFLTELSEQGGGRFLFANDQSSLTLADYLMKQMDRGETALVDEEIALEGRVRRRVERPAAPAAPAVRHDRLPLLLASLALLVELSLPPRMRVRREVPCAAS